MLQYSKMTEDKIESAGLRQYFEEHQPQIENALREHLPAAPPNTETQFNEAAELALFPGGRRTLPVLTLLGAELFGGKAETFLPVAAAVEFVHRSASIFDDLPSINGAQPLLNRTSLHEKFGEGLAIAVGVGLLNASYGLVFVNHNGLPERAMQAHAEIVECVGASGMIGAERSAKDAALLRLALRIGAILAGANYLELAQLTRFAEFLSAGDRASFEDAKRILVENFPSSEARTCLIQFTDHLAHRI